MQKEELRYYYKKLRKNIENKMNKSTKICNKIINSNFYEKANIIAVYKNLEDEVDLSLFIKNALYNKKTVLLPRIKKNEMEFYKIYESEILETNKYGIEEPKLNYKNLVDKNKIDLFIIPGIVFDKYKNRIGFGKGYYDKYLSDCKNTMKVGVCFEEQIYQEKINVEQTDVKMECVITDKKIYM